MSITKVFKIIDPRSIEKTVTDNDMNYGGRYGGLYGNYSWYHRLITGSAQRVVKYQEYDIMDADVDVSRALDIIAEEMVGNNSKSEIPLIIKLELDGGVKVQSRVVSTLNAALKTWCNIHDWKNRTFKIARNTIKYGDCFYMRPKKKNGRFVFRHPKNVIAATVSEMDVTDVKGWYIRNTPYPVDQSPTNGSLYYNNAGQLGDISVDLYSSDEVVRFSLCDEMSEETPFGRSVLADIFKAFKQKQLLEDAVLIYRIQRSPERRVFKIDVSHVHPAKVAQHLEQIKNELRQRKIPSSNGGKSSIESIYDPQSMNEDFFFAKYKDGRESTVETLQAGMNLGELSDLDYFYKRMWRGLRIPQSYIDPNADGGTFNDGKVGIAYLQEIKFSLYVERLQSHLESTFDKEFKRFLRDSNIIVDESIFKVILPSPSNYATSRKQQIDNDLLNTYGSADSISSLSKRFGLKKYLQLTDEEIIMNERMLREEKGLDPNGDFRDLPKLYNPEEAEAGGFEGGLGSFGGSSSHGSSPDIPTDLNDLVGDSDTTSTTGEQPTDNVQPEENSDNENNI